MVRYLEAIEAQPHSDPDGSELEGCFTSSAQHLVQEQISDLGFSLADRRAYAAGFRIRLQARWGEALDLFELLMNECTDIGGEVERAIPPSSGGASGPSLRSTHAIAREGFANNVGNPHAP